MLPFRPPQTAEAASAAISALTDSAWVLAAVVDVLSREGEMRYGADDPVTRVLAAAGLLVLADDGDGDTFAPAPGLASIIEVFGAARADMARSVLGHAASVARAGGIDAASQHEDDTLLAQASASGRLLTALLPIMSAQVPGLEQRLREPHARFLDVGVGAAGLSCALAEVFPTLTIVGIDPLERAIRLAERRVAERGLDGRVTLRTAGVEDLTDVAAFDAAFAPAPFLPREVFAASLANLHRALRPGAWMLLAIGRLDGEGVAVEVTRWQTALFGGTPLTGDEARAALTDAGFEQAVVLDTPPGAPACAAARRPA